MPDLSICFASNSTDIIRPPYPGAFPEGKNRAAFHSVVVVGLLRNLKILLVLGNLYLKSAVESVSKPSLVIPGYVLNFFQYCFGISKS